MKSESSRRNFLAAGLALPAAGYAAAQAQQTPAQNQSRPAPAAGGQLTYRTLGKTGLRVTSLGFGCMITSDASVVSRAVDMGITYFDTARGYQSGNNERMVGTCIKGVRDKITLSSKSQAKTAEEAKSHLETSLRELGTDHLDVWFMHARDSAEAIPDELVAYWETAKKEGKIRFIGVSTHNPNAIVDRVLQAGKFDVLLSTYNFAVGKNNDAAYDRLRAAGIGLVAMKVMAPASRGGGRGPNAAPRTVIPGGPSAALKWVLKDSRFSVAIPSMTDADQLLENFRAMAEPYTPADEKVLVALDRDIRPLYCRMCHQCDGQCPKGVPVPDTLRYLSYADFYGQFALGRENFMALPQEVRDVRCSDCDSCSVKCVNGVRVAERLIKAQELFA